LCAPQKMLAQQEASPVLLPSTPALLPSTSSAGAFTPEASCGDEGCWPSMYLVGAQKASTTALFQLLRTSSGICGAKARPGSFPAASYKEVHFFDNDGVPWEGADGARANASLYTRLFRREECASRRFLDATPQYQYSWHAPMRMRLFVPETWRPRVRMITILREPLSRDLSSYNHRVDENLQRSNWTLGWYDGLVPVQKFCLAPTVHRGRPRLPRYEDEVRCEAERWNGCLESAGVGRPLREQYEHCMATGRYHGSIVRGVYAMHLARWTRYFSRQQILVLQYTRSCTPTCRGTSRASAASGGWRPCRPWAPWRRATRTRAGTSCGRSTATRGRCCSRSSGRGTTCCTRTWAATPPRMPPPTSSPDGSGRSTPRSGAQIAR
jgi:hypothetical protein